MKTTVLKKYHGYILLMVLSFLVSMVYPYLLEYLVDHILLTGQWEHLTWWFALTFATVLLGGMTSFYFLQYTPIKLGINNTFILERTSLRNILRLSQPEYIKEEKGYYYNLCSNSCAAYGDLHEEIHLRLIGNVIFAVMILAVIFYISPLLTVFFLLYILVLAVVSLNASKPLFHMQKDVVEKQDVYLGRSRNIIENKTGINALHVEDFFSDRFHDISETYCKHILRYRFFDYLAHFMPGQISQFFKVCFLFIASMMVMRGSLTLGVLLMVYHYMDYLANPVAAICGIVMRYRSSKVHIDRVDDLDAQSQLPDQNALHKTEKEYLFKTETLDLYKGPEEQDYLFSAIKMDIKKGGLYVLKGENGSGKTMFLNFLLGNVDASFSKGDFHVSQDIDRTVMLTYPFFAVDGKLEDNLFGIPLQKSLTEILNIDFAEKEIDSSNINLSYGQQQKLSLLRVLSQDAPAIFLDEPLSNLDVQTQENVIRYLEEIKGSRTIIAVMHGQELDEVADRIYTIKDRCILAGCNP